MLNGHEAQKPMTLMNSARLVLSMFLVTAFNVTAADIRQGLVAYWQMEGLNGSFIPDATPFSNNLNVVNIGGGNFVAGQVGNAVSLNGSSTLMTNLHTPDPSLTGLPIYKAGSYTITMWVKGAAQTAKYLYTEGNTNVAGSTAGQNPLFILQTGQAATNNAKLDAIIRFDAGANPVNHVVSTNVVFDNNWHHIAWVDDRGSVKVYIDGNLDPANFSYTPPAVAMTLNTSTVGALTRASVAGYFSGLIDDVALWRRALSAAEVQQVRTNSIATPIPTFPPVVVVQPRGSTNHIGDRTSFSATADGSPPLSYQWFKDNVEVPGATSTTLSFSNLITDQSGDYVLRATNRFGTNFSSAASLLVLPDPAADLRQGIISYWSIDDEEDDGTGRGALFDTYGHNDFKAVGPGGFIDLVPGIFLNAIQFDGVDQYCIREGGFPVYNNPGYTIAFWVNASASQSDRRIFAESSTNNANSVLSFGSQTNGANGTLRVFLRNDIGLTLLDRSSAHTVLDDTWHHVVWSDNNGEVRLYIDGVLDEASFNYSRGSISLDTTTIGALLSGVTAGNFFNGTLDEVSVWSRPISFTEVQQLRAAPVPAPIADVPPTITAQPVSRSVFTRANVTFSFAASGTGPLTWNWRKGGDNLSGQTNATLVLSNVTVGDAGDYDVVVSNSLGGATSQIATLTVTLRPVTTDLKIDFANLGADDVPANTEPGFASFALDVATEAGPVTRAFGGAEVTLTSAGGINVQSRKRALPVNTGAFTQEKLLQDFIFAADSAADQGLDVLVSFLDPFAAYSVTVWSYDNTSAGNRISDWYMNGDLVKSNYVFNGSTLPVDNSTYSFSFTAVADASGSFVIQGRRNPGATAANNVFINALQMTLQPRIHIQKIELTTTNTLHLTIEGINPGATHRVQQITAITDVWSDLPEAVFGAPSGNTIDALIPLPDTATRFYRVVESP